jgi:transposase
MAREHLTMRKVREILRLKYEQDLNNRDIAASCRISPSTVSEYVTRARTAGVVWPLPTDMSDADLEVRLFPPASSEERAEDMPDWQCVARELRRKGVTLQLLWEEYHEQHPKGYGYSFYCALYRRFTASIDPRMRQAHEAGHKLFVDYAGMTVPVVDRHTGEVFDAQIFVATLGASNYTYVEATATQTLPDWIGSHVRALEFFGGVPRVVIPDNLKSGVTSAHLYEPDVNRTYMDVAQHYGFAVVPARPVHPRDKAKVESHVQIVERWILARLRNRRFLSLQDLNEAIEPLLDKLNSTPFQKLRGTRQSVFEELDRPALSPLPTQRYVYAQWSKARVNIDYHIEVDERYYSVHYDYIKKQVDVRSTAIIVEIFYKGERLASHMRGARAGQTVTLPEHMPSHHKAHAEWTPERIIRWAGESGESVGRAVDTILSRHVYPEQGFRSCLGIMRLGQKHGADRLNAACARILQAGSPSYKSIQSILLKGLDSLPLPEQTQEVDPIMHANIRGADYYGRPGERQPHAPAGIPGDNAEGPDNA